MEILTQLRKKEKKNYFRKIFHDLRVEFPNRLNNLDKIIRERFSYLISSRCGFQVGN